jgi:uncharacterized protein DUF1573
MTRLQKFMRLLYIVPAVLACHTLPAQPLMAVADSVKDVGSIHSNEKINYDFIISNKGNAPLEIKDAKGSCSCTVTEFDKTIAAGKTGKVHATVDPSSFDGQIVKIIAVSTNDPAYPELTLTIKANVIQWLSPKPGFVRFSVVKGAVNASTQSSIIVSPGGTNFNILKASIPTPGAEVSFQEATESQRLPGFKGKQWVVSVKLNDNVTIGPLAGYILLTTDDPHQKEVKISLTGVVRPLFRVDPVKMDIGKVSDLRDYYRNIVIRTNTDGDIPITSAETTVKGITAKVMPAANKGQYQIMLSFDPQMAKGVFDGKVIAHTASSFMPVIEVELKGEVQ